MSDPLLIEQAWLMTWERLPLANITEQRFVGIFDHTISSRHMAQMVEQTYACNQLRPYEQARHLQHPYEDLPRADFMYLNDGSVFEDIILCGADPILWARRVYDLRVSHQEHVDTLTWREPHVFVEHDERIIDFWEDFALTVKRPLDSVL